METVVVSESQVMNMNIQMEMKVGRLRWNNSSWMRKMFLENRRKYTVREAVVESFRIHRKIYRDAKKGKPDPHGFLAETVLTWYEDGGSRVFLLELAKKQLEKLTLAEVSEILHWNFKITNCRNPCKTCGQVLELDDEFWFVPFSYCEEYGCGIQICSNCVMELAFGLEWKSDKSQILLIKDAIKQLKSHDKCLLISESVKLLRDYKDWVRDIEYDCKQKKEPPVASIPITLPSCKLINEVCSYDICPKRLKVKVLTQNEIRELVKSGCTHDDGHLREEGTKNEI